MSRKASARSSGTRKSAASKGGKRALSGGYHFRILWVDLTRGEARVVPFGDNFALKYIGGRGFGAKLLFDRLPKIKDPFGPENILTIAPGPLTGLYLPGAAKTHFIALAPLTGIYGDSNMGGNFGPEIRQAGYDALVIDGRASELSYLWIDEDEVHIVPAPELAGMGCLEAEGRIKERLQSQDVRVAAIGPAGENLVRFATINCDWSRNAGRCGMGALLGSKNLKAIAVRGGKALPVADVAALRLLTDRSLAELAAHPMFEFWQQQGLMSVVDYLNSAGGLPTRNFQQNVFEDADKIDGFAMEKDFKIGDTACFGCPMSCGNIYVLRQHLPGEEWEVQGHHHRGAGVRERLHARLQPRRLRLRRRTEGQSALRRAGNRHHLGGSDRGHHDRGRGERAAQRARGGRDALALG